MRRTVTPAALGILLLLTAAPAAGKPAGKGAKAAKSAKGTKAAKGDKAAQGEKPAGSKAKLWVSSKKPKPGDPILVKVTGTTGTPRGSAGGRRLIFFPVKGGWQAVFAVPLGEAPEADAGPAAAEPAGRTWWQVWHDREPPDPAGGGKAAPGSTLTVRIAGTGLRETLTIRPHTFSEESIKIDEALANPPAHQVKEIDADNAAVLAALRNDDPPMFRGRFRAPAGKKTSAFGNWRRFNDSQHRSRHLGLDAAARKGAPVRAVQRGKVALVRSGILMGGIVVVVHGAGLASAYFHVSDFAVKAGEVVEPGQVLGKVGVTGRTTGPHVHVGIYARGGFVDPAVFFKLPIAAPLAPASAKPAVARPAAARRK